MRCCMGGTTRLGRGLGPIGPGDSFFLAEFVSSMGAGLGRMGATGGGLSGTGATILEYSSGEGPWSVSGAGGGTGGSQLGGGGTLIDLPPLSDSVRTVDIENKVSAMQGNN